MCSTGLDGHATRLLVVGSFALSGGPYLANALGEIADGELDVVLCAVPLKRLRVRAERALVCQQLFMHLGLDAQKG